jgi:uncharacterized protein YcbX
MKIDAIWQYPVKSFIGNSVPSASFDELGMIGDRMWAIRDHEKGGIRGAKKIGDLMKFAATSVDDTSTPQFEVMIRKYMTYCPKLSVAKYN